MHSDQNEAVGLQPLSANDRRRFFRVDDHASLRVRPVAAGDEHRIAEQVLKGSPDSSALAGTFFAMSQQQDHLLRNFKKRQPDIAEYVSTMNEKLDLLARAMFLQHNELAEQPRQEVNLSASGISFRSEKPLQNGAVMELKLLAYPSLLYIHSLCEVIRCEPAQEPGARTDFEIGLDFKVIREDDRDLLIQHVVQLESIQLRNRRSG